MFASRGEESDQAEDHPPSRYSIQLYCEGDLALDDKTIQGNYLDPYLPVPDRCKVGNEARHR